MRSNGACAIRLYGHRQLTSNGEAERPTTVVRQGRRRILSFSASDAQPQTYHGPLQRWLGRTAPSGAYHAYHDAKRFLDEPDPGVVKDPHAEILVWCDDVNRVHDA
jgi:hypothetical protein